MVNEKTSTRLGRLASKALRGEKLTKKEIKELAGSVLVQRRPLKKS